MKIGKFLGNDPEIGFSIEDRLEQAISVEEGRRTIDDEIINHGERIITGPGKRIRMWAGYNAAKAFDPKLGFEEVIDSMIPVEVLHGFSLVIDDFDDGDELRREHPTLHEFILNGIEGVREDLESKSPEVLEQLETEVPEKYHDGLVESSKRAQSMANHYGNLLRTKAYDWISESENITEDHKLDIGDILRAEEKKLPIGQTYDLESEEFLTNPDAEELASKVGENFDFDGFYDDVIGLKTAPLFVAPIKIAGEITEEEQEKVDELAKAIEYTAKAFQIRDDVIDITQGSIGKDRYSDIREGTLNMPLFKSLEYFKKETEKAENIAEDYTEELGYVAENMLESYGSTSEFLEHVISSDYVHDKEIEIAGELVQEAPAIEESNELAKGYAQKAEDIYQSLEVEDEEYLGNLNSINWMAATRSK